MGKTIALMVTINATSDSALSMRDALASLTAKTRNEPGNVFYIPLATLARPGDFIIYEKWKDKDALDFHMNQPYLKEFLEWSKAFLATPIKGVECEEILC